MSPSTPPMIDGSVEKASFSMAEHVPTRDAAELSTQGHVQGNIQLTDQDGNIRQVPTPTSSVRDPLNFATWRKAAIIFTTALFSTFSIGGVASFSALLNVFFGLYLRPPYLRSETDVLRLVTLPSLMIGVGNFVFVPVAIIWGRRPMFLAGGLMFTIAAIGAATSTTYNSHLISRLFMGLGAGAAEVLVPLTVTDISFIHQRETFIAISSVIQQIVTSALSIGSTYMAVNTRWQTYYWVMMGLGFFGLALMAFLCLETRFSRPAAYIDGQMVTFDAFGNMKVVSDADAKDVQAHEIHTSTHGVDGHDTLTVWQGLSPFPPLVKNPVREFVSVWASMALALVDPGILWALGLQTLCLANIIVISLSLPTLLQGVYHWAPQNVGLVAIAPAIGPLFAVPYGMLADKFIVRLSARHNGKHTPEDRMFILIVPILLAGVANVMYGYLASKAPGPHWFGALFMYGALYFTFVVITVTLVSFTVEHASHHPGPALVLVLGAKNILSYPISNALAPIVAQGRYLWIHGILTGALFAWSSLGFILFFALPRYRAFKASKNIEI